MADAEEAPSLAVMIASNARPLFMRYIGFVPTVKAALVAPWGTTMLGVVAARSVFELVSVTTWPPAGAGTLSVTVPVDRPPLPPVIVAGLSVTDTTAALATPGVPKSSARTSTLCKPARDRS